MTDAISGFQWRDYKLSRSDWVFYYITVAFIALIYGLPLAFVLLSQSPIYELLIWIPFIVPLVLLLPAFAGLHRDFWLFDEGRSGIAKLMDQVTPEELDRAIRSLASKMNAVKMNRGYLEVIHLTPFLRYIRIDADRAVVSIEGHGKPPRFLKMRVGKGAVTMVPVIEGVLADIVDPCWTPSD